MKPSSGYKSIPVTYNRRAEIASATVTRGKNAIHCITEVDITEPRRLIKELYNKTGDKLSFTGYIVTCLAHVIKDHHSINSFIKGRRQIILDDVTVSVLIERDLIGEKVPEPLGISNAQAKTYKQINAEIRDAQNRTEGKLGSLSGMTWVRLIPGFLLRSFIRIADRNINMAKRYAKVNSAFLCKLRRQINNVPQDVANH